MAFLKTLVVVMGVMIIAGFTFLVVEVVKRMNDPDRAVQSERSAPLATGDVGSGNLATVEGGIIGLGLPKGSRMSDPVAVGNRVMVRVTLPASADRPESDRLYVLDNRNGAVLGVVTTGTPAEVKQE